MRILSVGPMDGISNTCRFRNMALEKISDVVDVVNTSAKTTLWYRIAYHLFLYGLPVKLPDTARANKKIKNLIDQYKYDIVWIDKGLTIFPHTLRYIKQIQPQTILVNFSPDNMIERPWQSQQYLKCIPLYDYHITTKSYIIDDFYKYKAKKVILINKTFQSDFHYPRTLSLKERNMLGADIGFVGSWEKERCESVLYLAEHGLNVKVWGDGEWLKYKDCCPHLTITGEPLLSEDYAKSFSAFKISLCFLKKRAFDKQTARSVEIPACGGFMMAERTVEHQSLFEEDKEAVFFSSDEELLAKCRYYLNHEDERRRIAEAGRQRCLNSDYSNDGMIKKIIQQITCENGK